MGEFCRNTSKMFEELPLVITKWDVPRYEVREVATGSESVATEYQHEKEIANIRETDNPPAHRSKDLDSILAPEEENSEDTCYFCDQEPVWRVWLDLEEEDGYKEVEICEGCRVANKIGKESCSKI